MREYKVYGLLVFDKGKQVRAILKTTTKKKAIEILNDRGFRVTDNEFRNYACETGNETELRLACCDKVMISSGVFEKDFRIV